LARGKRTDPTAAVLAKVMAEMGFEPEMIAQITGIPRSTVNDIIQGHGPWSQMPQTELFETTRLRVRRAIESVADELAVKAIVRLEEKIKSASVLEACSIFDALTRIGG
jgi:predicted transcriptional regulator